MEKECYFEETRDKDACVMGFIDSLNEITLVTGSIVPLIGVKCLFCVVCDLRALIFSSRKSSKDLLTQARLRKLCSRTLLSRSPLEIFLKFSIALVFLM